MSASQTYQPHLPIHERAYQMYRSRYTRPDPPRLDPINDMDYLPSERAAQLSESDVDSLEGSDEFGRMLIQQAKDEERVQPTRHRYQQPFRLAGKITPRFTRDYEDFDQRELNDASYAPRPNRSPLEKPNTNDQSRPPVKPRLWSLARKQEPGWMRRMMIEVSKDDPPPEPEPTYEPYFMRRARLREEAQQRTNAWNRVEDVTEDVIEDLPLPSNEHNPDAFHETASHTPPYDQPRHDYDWDLAEDLSGSLLTSTPYKPYSKLDAIIQAEKDAAIQYKIDEEKRIAEEKAEEEQRRKEKEAEEKRRRAEEKAEQERRRAEEEERRAEESMLAAKNKIDKMFEKAWQEELRKPSPYSPDGISPILRTRSRSDTNASARLEASTQKLKERTEIMKRRLSESPSPASPSSPCPAPHVAGRENTSPTPPVVKPGKSTAPHQEPSKPEQAMNRASTPPTPPAVPHQKSTETHQKPTETRHKPTETQQKTTKPHRKPSESSHRSLELEPSQKPLEPSQKTTESRQKTAEPHQKPTAPHQKTAAPERPTSKSTTPPPHRQHKRDDSREILRALSRKLSNSPSPTNQSASQDQETSKKQVAPRKEAVPKKQAAPSVLSAILDKWRNNGTDNDFGDSTVESLNGLISPTGIDRQEVAIEDTPRESETPNTKPKTAAEQERQREMLQLRSMNARLHAARSSIRDANRNARHLENSVDTAEPLVVGCEACGCLGCHTHQSPLSMIWTGVKGLVLYHDHNRQQRLTWFGRVCLVLFLWYISEVVLSECLGTNLYAHTMDGYGVYPDRPRYPFVFLTFLSWIPPFRWLWALWRSAGVVQATRTVTIV